MTFRVVDGLASRTTASHRSWSSLDGQLLLRMKEGKAPQVWAWNLRVRQIRLHGADDQTIWCSVEAVEPFDEEAKAWWVEMQLCGADLGAA